MKLTMTDIEKNNTIAPLMNKRRNRVDLDSNTYFLPSINYFAAITSTSTTAPFGSAATWTVERAGNGAVKNFV